MKKPFLIIMMILAACLKARAWGAAGHKATALIAQTYLSPQAKQAIEELLDGEKLVDVANWADNLRDRPEYAHTAAYHYQNVRKNPTTLSGNPYKANLLQLSSAERYRYRAGVVEAISAAEVILNDEAAARRDRQAALKFLVHFVGDLHQPLHTGEARMYGGNGIQLRWKGSETNLHKVWDSDVINARANEIQGYNYRDPSYAYAQWLIDQNKEQALAPQALGDVSTWYQESLSFHKVAYDTNYENSQDQYQQDAAKVIDQRILQGGRRLGGILNQIFSHEPKPVLDQPVIMLTEKVLGSLEKLVSFQPKMTNAKSTSFR